METFFEILVCTNQNENYKVQAVEKHLEPISLLFFDAIALKQSLSGSLF